MYINHLQKLHNMTVEEIFEISKKYDIPYRHELRTRRNQCETILILSGVCKAYKGEKEQFNYKIQAIYPYSLIGEKDNYQAIDFSEGPTLNIGSVVNNMVVVEIDPPLIVFEKLNN